VEGELSDLVDLIAALEKPTGRLMPQVMEPKVYDPQYLTRARERRADAFRIVRKDEFGIYALTFNDCPSFQGVFESVVISFLVGRMLRVADDAAARLCVVIYFAQTAYLGLPSRGLDGEIHNVIHGDICTAVAMSKEVTQSRELIRTGPPVSPP
jgi:hypothetical protein